MSEEFTNLLDKPAYVDMEAIKDNKKKMLLTAYVSKHHGLTNSFGVMIFIPTRFTIISINKYHQICID